MNFIYKSNMLTLIFLIRFAEKTSAKIYSSKQTIPIKERGKPNDQLEKFRRT